MEGEQNIALALSYYEECANDHVGGRQRLRLRELLLLLSDQRLWTPG